MTDTTAPAAAATSGHADHSAHYKKIWGILLVLLVISVAGPFLGIRAVTLITAFGIALVKAYIVAKHFMHIGMERKWVTWLLVTMLLLMLVMLGGVSPDVYKHEGHNWENVAAKAAIKRGEAAGAEEHSGNHAELPKHEAPAGEPAHHEK